MPKYVWHASVFYRTHENSKNLDRTLLWIMLMLWVLLPHSVEPKENCFQGDDILAFLHSRRKTAFYPVFANRSQSSEGSGGKKGGSKHIKIPASIRLNFQNDFRIFAEAHQSMAETFKTSAAIATFVHGMCMQVFLYSQQYLC